MERQTLRSRLGRALFAARRELRAPAPPIWKLTDPRVPSERFAGRTVVVTGAAGVIGSVLTESFLAAGATVYALDNDASGLVALESFPGAAAAGTRLHTRTIDLSDPDAIVTFGSSIEHLDILVNNVGFNDDRRGIDVPDGDSWRRVLDVNLVGPALLTAALIDQLKASPAASVVFVTSINALAPSPWLHYGAAKAGVSKLSRDLAHDLALDGVRVNAVAPGKVMAAQRPADDRSDTPYGLGGGAPPVEAIVHAVAFFADAEMSPMTTGQELRVTGAPNRGGLIGR